MDSASLAQTTDLIVKDFELEPSDVQVTEEELLRVLADQIAYMIEYRLEFLLSLMYRLDVNERKVNAALSPMSETPANEALAKLVFERQKQRVFTKKHYTQDDFIDLDEELE